MSTASQDYVAAAGLLKGLVEERRADGHDVASGDQWIARLNARAKLIQGEEMKREASLQKLAHLLAELKLVESADRGYDAAKIIGQHFTLDPGEEEYECPF